MPLRAWLTLSALALLPAPALAQGRFRNPPPAPAPAAAEAPAFDVEAHYTKFEYKVPMRDGVRLFTAVYVPKDASRTYPILFTRTPYGVGPYGVDHLRTNLGPSPLFAKEGYIFAYQDVRGRWMSEGEFVNMRPVLAGKKSPQDVDESTDVYDTIDWLVKNVPGNSGKVGQWGISYPGFYTACGLIDAHPALKASSPQAPINDWFVGDDFHHNGALMLPHLFNFIADFGRPRPEPTRKPAGPRFEHDTPDGYAFFLRLGPLSNADRRYFKGGVPFWNEVMAHGTYDAFWQARNLRPHLKNVKPAVLTVGGWFDAENLFGALHTYRSIEASSSGISNSLVMGPWVHGGWSRGDGESLGPVRFGSKTGVTYREKIELPFFEYHLKGKGEGKFPEAWVFETGTNRWRTHDAWPPKAAQARSFYLDAAGRLSTAPPAGDGDDARDTFPSDPARPVPFQEAIAIGMDPQYMTADQRFASRRPDVLAYQTEVLTEDLVVAGPVEVDLHVATTGTDADWVVKLVDVYPDDYPDPNPNPSGVRLGGYQQLVRGDVMRGKFRNSYEKPEPFEPGRPARVRLTLPDTCHAFRPGHRLMIQVQSSWFPLVDRNPQSFTDIYHAQDKDFRPATHSVFRSAGYSSRVTVRVLPAGD